MYAGTTLNRHSGNLLGVHQKIDRTARKKLEELLPGCGFPRSRAILSFEGNNGPDGIKRKSAGCDEPSHFYDPYGSDDQEIIAHIKAHYLGLVESLKLNDSNKAAFEASWLAHSLVDGLTPAHHYPYEEEVDELRGDPGEDEGGWVKRKAYMKGETKRDSLRKNWAFWGAKGLMISHAGFEFGVASIAALGKIKLKSTKDEIDSEIQKDVIEIFKNQAEKIDNLEMFDKFCRYGWSPKLANQTKKILLPTLTETVTAIWYKAAKEAES
jgi:hypothetical protein